ncbi:hypothetical protein ACFQY0_08855 [Haloferula chungangensis]|uniref:Uncharacterized protein n=1 Tax=Haloferula chungangensis TaxID=1048331 RepID=A0ABW2L866_9BACT
METANAKLAKNTTLDRARQSLESLIAMKDKLMSLGMGNLATGRNNRKAKAELGQLERKLTSPDPKETSKPTPAEEEEPVLDELQPDTSEISPPRSQPEKAPSLAAGARARYLEASKISAAMHTAAKAEASARQAVLTSAKTGDLVACLSDATLTSMERGTVTKELARRKTLPGGDDEVAEAFAAQHALRPKARKPLLTWDTSFPALVIEKGSNASREELSRAMASDETTPAQRYKLAAEINRRAR